jgi:hypothetical protein
MHSRYLGLPIQTVSGKLTRMYAKVCASCYSWMDVNSQTWNSNPLAVYILLTDTYHCASMLSATGVRALSRIARAYTMVPLIYGFIASQESVKLSSTIGAQIFESQLFVLVVSHRVDDFPTHLLIYPRRWQLMVSRNATP